MLTIKTLSLDRMRKASCMLSYFCMFTGLLWALDQISKEEKSAFLQFIAFATQIQVGSMCYDVLKTMRAIPARDSLWRGSVDVFGMAIFLAVVIVGLLLIGRVHPVAAIAMVIIAAGVYLYIFIGILPRLQHLYVQAVARRQGSVNAA